MTRSGVAGCAVGAGGDDLAASTTGPGQPGLAHQAIDGAAGHWPQRAVNAAVGELAAQQPPHLAGAGQPATELSVVGDPHELRGQQQAPDLARRRRPAAVGVFRYSERS